jgi:single-strand DNA-binding protein
MSNLNLNKVVLAGRITKDVELKQTTAGVAVVNFSIAVNRKYANGNNQPQTDFLDIVAWRQTAEFITRFFRKGSSICIVGSLQTRSWEDKNGNKRTVTEVVADEAMFVDSKSDAEPANEAYTSSPSPSVAPAPMPAQPKFEALSTDEDLPF